VKRHQGSLQVQMATNPTPCELKGKLNKDKRVEIQK